MALLLALGLSLQADEAALRDAVQRLAGDFLEEREAARKELEGAGRAAEKVLVAALDHADHRVRRTSLELLAGLQAKAALPRARDLFKRDDDAAVVDAAFRLLQSLGPDAEDALIDALDASNVEHVKGAIQSLTEARSAKCVARMAALDESHPDPAVKEAAFRHLQGIGAPAEEHLLKALKSPDAARCGAALAGLRGLTSDKVLTAVGDVFVVRPETEVINLAFEHLRGAAEKGTPKFLAGLKSVQEHARARSIEGLRGSPAAAASREVVAEVFRTDASASVRTQASEFLRALGPAAEGEFVASLASPNPAVRLLALQGLAELRGRTALPQVSKIFREDKDAAAHEAAFEYLRRLGAPAEKELLFAISDPDKKIRRLAVLALGDAKSVAAIPRLIDALSELDKDFKEAARDALVRIGPEALAAVEAAVKEGKLKPAAAEEIRAVAEQEEVERLLDLLVTEEGGSGHFEGQFKDLAAYGPSRSVPALVRIVKDPSHRFRFASRRDLTSYPAIVRELAVMALGELGDASAVSALKEVLAKEPETAGNLRDELLVSLHRLGEKGPLAEYLAATSKRIEADLKEGKREDAHSAIFSLGIVLNRSGRRDDAEAAYQRLAKLLVEKPAGPGEADLLPNTWYNLACLSSLKGDAPAAVERLRKAAKAGFRDREWIKIDRDLDGIRADAGYKALLADDALFEKPVR